MTSELDVTRRLIERAKESAARLQRRVEELEKKSLVDLFEEEFLPMSLETEDPYSKALRTEVETYEALEERRLMREIVRISEANRAKREGK